MPSFRPAPDPTVDHLQCCASSPPPSPLRLLLSPSAAHGLDTPHSALSALYKPPGASEQKVGSCNAGRLEDFLESTMGKPLLGVEPGGPLTLIDDLHSQMLCTPSILDHPSSPMETLDTEPGTSRGPMEQVEDSMDWLDLTMEEKRGKDFPTLATPHSQTPPSVFSTDFLDSYDLETAWDSCL